MTPLPPGLPHKCWGTSSTYGLTKSCPLPQGSPLPCHLCFPPHHTRPCQQDLGPLGYPIVNAGLPATSPPWTGPGLPHAASPLPPARSPNTPVYVWASAQDGSAPASCPPLPHLGCSCHRSSSPSFCRPVCQGWGWGWGWRASPTLSTAGGLAYSLQVGRESGAWGILGSSRHPESLECVCGVA